jgi:uncharacterized protein YhbP (UPF0306 family)
VSPDGAGELRRLARTYLEEHQVLTLATNGPLGLWAAAVFYVSQEFLLYFLSASHTRHAQNLRANSRVAATIQEDYADWVEIKGIQLEGSVELLTGPEREKTITLYGTKYPFVGAASGAIADALQRVDWYRLTPERLFFIDNNKGFGHRDEIALPNIG